jgi:uncharacterized protein YukE
VIGLGATIDSTRTNQIYKLPQGLAKEYKNYKNALQKLRDEIAAREAALAAAQNPTPNAREGEPDLAVPTNVSELLAVAKKYDGATDVSSSTFQKASSAYDLGIQAESLLPDYYYVPTGLSTDDPEFIKKLKDRYEALYLTGADTSGKFKFSVKPKATVA